MCINKLIVEGLNILPEGFWLWSQVCWCCQVAIKYYTSHILIVERRQMRDVGYNESLHIFLPELDNKFQKQ